MSVENLHETSKRIPPDLTEFGNVPAAYRHEWRSAEPVAPLVLERGIFKWYHVHRDGVAIPAELDSEARELIRDRAGQGGWPLEYGLNFALIHLSTEAAFLIAGIWRGHQELWELVYAKQLAGGPFTRVPMEGEISPAACVWEMGVIVHERMAWHNYLFSKRDEAAKQAWLADTYTGRV
jgi:hypothetical protein